MTFFSGIKLRYFGASPLVDNLLYIQLVRILLYLTHSLPDLSYVIGVLSRYMHPPHEIHWKESKRILQYVQGTSKFEVHYASSSLELVGFSDSDWARNPND